MKNFMLCIGFLLSFDYCHKHAEPDLFLTTVKIETIKDIYLGIGYSASIDPNFLECNKFYSNIENFSVGITFKF